MNETTAVEPTSESSAPAKESRPRPAPASLAVTITDLPNAVVVQIEGQANTETIQQMQLALMRLIARRTPMAVLDLARLTYVTTLAIGLLVGLRRDLARWGGRVRIAAIRPEVYESLDVSRLTELFEFFDTVEAATAA
jgi:anti-anti-sigma factor